MLKLKIRSQSLPERCEVCHQADCFDAGKNYCSRCASVSNISEIRNRALSTWSPESNSEAIYHASLVSICIGILSIVLSIVEAVGVPGVVIGITLILLGWIGSASYLGTKRANEVGLAARDMGLSFIRKVDPMLLSRLEGFHLFSQGHSKTISNLIHGEINGTEVMIFDYRYTVGGGKSSSTHSQTVICMRSDRLNLPAFSLRPENVLHRIGSVFGYQDIDFSESPAFSEKYLLRGPNEQAIRAVFNRRVLSFFEDFYINTFCTEADGNQLIYYRENDSIKPDSIRSFLSRGFEVLNIFLGEK
jgi:hypothetical protein